MAIAWDDVLRDCDRRLRSSDIRDLLAVTERPDVISFAGGLPAPELFPTEGMRAAFDAVLATDGKAALQYGPTEGYAPLRELLAGRLRARGIRASEDEILLTTGSQQALDLLGKVLLHPDATVAVEAPSYIGALQAFAALDARFLALPMDGAGLAVDALDGILRRSGPSLLYTVPTFQNPSGVTMGLERRAALLALCAGLGVPLIEDDPYGDLRYSGVEVSPLRALPGGEDTVYLGTFSKILAPGLRLGWVVGPRALIRRLVVAKQGTDLHTDSLVQRAVLWFCTHHDLAGHVARLRSVYGARRDAMLGALSRHMPPSVQWTEPEGGLFLWLTLPEGVDSRALLGEALRRRVAFVPGNAFYADGTGGEHLRLNFSHTPPEQIEEGVRRLAAALSAWRLESVAANGAG